MIHLNAEPSNSGIYRYTRPQSYVVDNLGEFVKNRDLYVPTKSIMFPAVVFRGKSLVFLESPAQFINQGMVVGTIVDETGEAQVQLSLAQRVSRRLGKSNLRNNYWLSHVTLVYDCAQKTTELYNFEKTSRFRNDPTLEGRVA